MQLECLAMLSSGRIEEGQELTTLDPQTDSSGVGRVNSATLDRQ